MERESEQGKVGVEFTSVINYKTSLVVNGKPTTVLISIGEGGACNTIFSLPLLQTMKASMMTKNNSLVSGLLGDQFKLDIMVTQRAKESTKTSEGPTVSLSVLIEVKQDNTKEICSRNSIVELNKAVIHQRHIPGQN